MDRDAVDKLRQLSSEVANLSGRVQQLECTVGMLQKHALDQVKRSEGPLPRNPDGNSIGSSANFGRSSRSCERSFPQPPLDRHDDAS